MLEQAAPSKDGRINPTSEAADSTVLEPHMDLVSHDAYATETPDSSPAIGSEPCEPADAELDRLSIFKFSVVDIFQYSPSGDVLNSIKNLSLAKDSQPNYIRLGLGADDGEFYFPPATHFIATTENSTDTLDYDSENIDGMDNDTDDNKDPVDTTNEQDEWEDRQVSPAKLATHEDSEDDNYLPLFEDEVGLGTKDFIVPKEPREQERFKRQLIATARSLKKKQQQQLQDDQDLLKDRWTEVLAA